MNSISIIIPTLNESETIEALLTAINNHAIGENISEILVVDGGSTDGTIAILENLPNIKLVRSKKGRAKQLNCGANLAKGTILYFLHADSIPPKGFDMLIIDEVRENNLAGCFRLKFDSNHWWLNIAGWFTKFNWSICRGGDQSLFIDKKLFNDMGGFDENFQIYEDNVLIKKLYQNKQFSVIPSEIITSARLYKKHGVWKLQYYFLRIHLMHFFGASAEEIYQYYKKNIAT